MDLRSHFSLFLGRTKLAYTGQRITSVIFVVHGISAAWQCKVFLGERVALFGCQPTPVFASLRCLRSAAARIAAVAS